MALSKVLQMMAEKHKNSSENNPPISESKEEDDQSNGAQGILLTLLTEPAKNKGKPTSHGVSQNEEIQEKNTETDADTDVNSQKIMKGGTVNSAASVLMSLLKEKKSSVVSQSGGKNELKPDSPKLEVLEAKERDVTPIVIEPAKDSDVENRNKEKSGASDNPHTLESMICTLCDTGFWDRDKFDAHMRIEHGNDRPNSFNNPMIPSQPGNNGVVDTPSPTDRELRRSKRKRKPARMKYCEPDSTEDESFHSSTSPPPKIPCADNRVTPTPEDSLEKDRAATPSNSSVHSVPCSEDSDSTQKGLKLRIEPGSVVGTLKVEDGKVENTMTFKCSFCHLQFKSKKETKSHLIKDHNILPNTSPQNKEVEEHHTSLVVSHSSCSTCGCKGNITKKNRKEFICLVCGTKAKAGMKKFIHVFKVRTWSSRYHSLPKRFSMVFGCEFSTETCLSNHACVACVRNLETVEKAKLLKSKMISALKSTHLVLSSSKIRSDRGNEDLVSPTEKKKKAKSAGSASSPPLEEPRSQVPAAPLVRELLTAPEVVLPSSQFSQLIDAIGSDKETVGNPFTTPALAPNSQLRYESQKMGSAQNSGRKRNSKRLTAVQHDDEAFSHFVNQLTSHNTQQGEKNPSSDSGGGDNMGRVLAVVQVKEEPIDEEQKGEGAKNKGNNHENMSLVPSSQGGVVYGPGNAIGEYRSTYTELQIDSQTGQAEFNCMLCNTIFYSEAAIQIHVKCHVANSKELRCFLCGFHSTLLPTQWRIMKRHLESEHSFPETHFHKFPCPVPGCAELFKSHRDLIQHVTKNHHGFAKLSQQHTLSERGLFDFPCHLCGTLLFSEAALEIHILCHNGTAKFYQCFYCNYMHNSQPGSWRIMRGHLTKAHVGKELSQDTFSFYECPYYACRLKFCTKKAQIIHRACHDETKDGEFFCFHCHYSCPSTPYLWEKVKEHIIARHPEMVGESFRCSCKLHFQTYRELLNHMMTACRYNMT